jgi:hypothetical protein
MFIVLAGVGKGFFNWHDAACNLAVVVVAVSLVKPIKPRCNMSVPENGAARYDLVVRATTVAIASAPAAAVARPRVFVATGGCHKCQGFCAFGCCSRRLGLTGNHRLPKLPMPLRLLPLHYCRK